MTSIPNLPACLNCGSAIPDDRLRNRARYCSKRCQATYSFGSSHTAELSISAIKVGALSELVVCADLLRHGYEVFRGVSADDSCDIVILRGREMRRIQVRTGHIRGDGGIVYGRYAKDDGRMDHYAVVIDHTKVLYFPDLQI